MVYMSGGWGWGGGGGVRRWGLAQTDADHRCLRYFSFACSLLHSQLKIVAAALVHNVLVLTLLRVPYPPFGTLISHPHATGKEANPRGPRAKYPSKVALLCLIQYYDPLIVRRRDITEKYKKQKNREKGRRKTNKIKTWASY